VTVSPPTETAQTGTPADAEDALMAKLEAAAIAAIRNERPGIIYDRSRLRGIQVDLTVANNGSVVEGEVYINRRANVGRVLGVRG
jgi:hypothetical protein